MGSLISNELSAEARKSLLDFILPRWLWVLTLLVISIVPIRYVWMHYDSQHGFTSLILFGAEFQERELPEVKALHPAINSTSGYDGQFYAQIAIDPALTRPELPKALDDPPYRAGRILLPALAYLVGFGHPAGVVTAYALLNLVFWFILAGGIIYHLQTSTARHHLCLVAILLTTGALISIQRSLGDLPATTLVFFSACGEGLSAAAFIALAILAKPTFGLFLLRYAWPFPEKLGEVGNRLIYIFVALAPAVLWTLYICHALGREPDSGGNIGWPFKDLIHHIALDWQALQATAFPPTLPLLADWIWKLFDFLAPFSLLVQASHFILWRAPRCAFWWLGLAFTLLFVCLTTPTLIEQIALCRTVLPMTVAFNMRLVQQRGMVYILYFIAGNIGLVWSFIDMSTYGIPL